MHDGCSAGSTTLLWIHPNGYSVAIAVDQTGGLFSGFRPRLDQHKLKQLASDVMSQLETFGAQDVNLF